VGSDTQKCIDKSDTNTPSTEEKIEKSDTIISTKNFNLDEAIKTHTFVFFAPIK
jgi:hypothetical protein